MSTGQFASCVLLVGLLAACANEQDKAGQGPQQVQKADAPATGELSVHPATGNARDVGPEAAGSEVSFGPGLQRLVDLAMQDLAARLGVETDAIKAVQGAYVTWRDSGLGCPQPGYQYLQVLTNGSRIRLSDGKRVYQYHSGQNRPPFWCETPSAAEPLPYAPGEMYGRARTSL